MSISTSSRTKRDLLLREHDALELVWIWWNECFAANAQVSAFAKATADRRSMSLAIAGMGWVTPLGTGVDSVWERLLQGEEASATTISEQFADRVYNVFRVPESALKRDFPSAPSSRQCYFAFRRGSWVAGVGVCGIKTRVAEC